MALVDIANNALGRIGGAGDQVTGESLVTAAQLAADGDKVSQWINDKYPVVRKKVIADFAAMKCPFRETRKFAELGDDLHDDDVAISTIVSSAGVVTVTTDEVHGRTTADTVFLSGIEGTLVDSLNGTTKTITVVDTTSFTLNSVTGTDAWDHTADTGIISDCPESGAWQYAFSLPSDFFVMVRQCNESYTTRYGVRREYQYDVILNRDGDDFILLTNDLSNIDGDSAYIEYCIDQETFALFSPAFEECIAILLAAELCPVINRNAEERVKLLLEYKQVTVPEAKRYNQSQYNNRAKVVPDFSGGRSAASGGIVAGLTSDLGTYVDAQGNRRSI